MLLYAFVWSIVRSSSRQLRTAQPPPPPAPPAERAARGRARRRAAAVRRRRVAQPPPSPPPVLPPPRPEPSQPTEEPIYAAPTVVPRIEDRADEADEDSRRLDLSANLDPRLVVEASPVARGGPRDPAGGRHHDRPLRGAPSCRSSDQFVSHMHARILRRGAYHFVVRTSAPPTGPSSTTGASRRDAQLKVHDALRIGQTHPPLRGVDGRRGHRGRPAGPGRGRRTSRTPAGSATTTRTARSRAPGCSRWPTAWAAPRPARWPPRWPWTRSARLVGPVARRRRARGGRAGQPGDPAPGDATTPTSAAWGRPSPPRCWRTATSTWCTSATRAPTSGATASCARSPRTTRWWPSWCAGAASPPRRPRPTPTAT